MTEAQRLGRVDTGVPGLDTILSGGLFKGGVYIVEGSPGSGKTILGNQMCFHRVARGDRTVYVTLLAESHSRLIAHLRGLSFFRSERISRAQMPPSVLIVDDELGLADIIAELLTAAGYDVVVAINGKLGLASLVTRRAEIVVTDLMMPIMDGPEMSRRMKADPALARIPIILMTEVSEVVPTDDAGKPDAVLVKPFSLRALIETIHRLLPPSSSSAR